MFDPFNYSFQGMGDEDLKTFIGDEAEIIEILSEMSFLAGVREADKNVKYTAQICKMEKDIKDFLD